MINSTKLLNWMINWTLNWPMVSIRPLLTFHAKWYWGTQRFWARCFTLATKEDLGGYKAAKFDLISSSTKPSTLYKCRKRHPRDVKQYGRPWVLRCLFLCSGDMRDMGSKQTRYGWYKWRGVKANQNSSSLTCMVVEWLGSQGPSLLH